MVKSKKMLQALKMDAPHLNGYSSTLPPSAFDSARSRCIRTEQLKKLGNVSILPKLFAPLKESLHAEGVITKQCRSRDRTRQQLQRWQCWLQPLPPQRRRRQWQRQRQRSVSAASASASAAAAAAHRQRGVAAAAAAALAVLAAAAQRQRTAAAVAAQRQHNVSVSGGCGSAAAARRQRQPQP